jgi:F0F1-type ATP synthase epsilon subunit
LASNSRSLTGNLPSQHSAELSAEGYSAKSHAAFARIVERTYEGTLDCPVLARLRPTELRLHMPGGEVQRWAQAEGWLEVFANRATVLVGEAVRPDQLDEGELRNRIEDADARLKESEEGSGAHTQAERDKARAEAFIAVAGADS